MTPAPTGVNVTRIEPASGVSVTDCGAVTGGGGGVEELEDVGVEGVEGVEGFAGLDAELGVLGVEGCETGRGGGVELDRLETEFWDGGLGRFGADGVEESPEGFGADGGPWPPEGPCEAVVVVLVVAVGGEALSAPSDPLAEDGVGVASPGRCGPSLPMWCTAPEASTATASGPSGSSIQSMPSLTNSSSFAGWVVTWIRGSSWPEAVS